MQLKNAEIWENELPRKKGTGEAGSKQGGREDRCLKQQNPGMNDGATMNPTSRPEYWKRMECRHHQRGQKGPAAFDRQTVRSASQ